MARTACVAHGAQIQLNSLCDHGTCFGQAYGLQLEDWGRSALSVVVVGASGDLARKKIFPALYALYHEGMLPEVRWALSGPLSGSDSNRLRTICDVCTMQH